MKTILVSLNSVSRAGEILKSACTLAARHESHLIGLYILPGIQYYAVPAGAHGAIDINKEQREYYESAEDEVKQQFEDMTRKHGVIGEWRSLQADTHATAGLAIEHAMQADLVIAGQTPEEGFDSFEPDFDERLVMESGRPVLVIPRTGSFETIGSHALVAWNGKAEAARAAHDAIPLLKMAEKTTIVAVNPHETIADDMVLEAAELAKILARHDVNVTAETINTGQANTGEVLLSKGAALGANLVVSGAYGHSRLREYVFGGVSRHLLGSLDIPTLFSH